MSKTKQDNERRCCRIDSVKWVVFQIERYLDLIENPENHHVVIKIRGLLNELKNI